MPVKEGEEIHVETVSLRAAAPSRCVMPSLPLPTPPPPSKMENGRINGKSRFSPPPLPLPSSIILSASPRFSDASRAI